MISIINKDNYKETNNQILVSQIREIQNEHLYNKDKNQDSYLITFWSDSEIETMIIKGSIFYLLHSEENLSGYFIISKINEFSDQLKTATHNFNINQLNNNKEWIYIYQFGVRSSLQNKGLISLLFKKVIESNQNKSFASDYMISPRINSGSERIFKKFNFIKNGEMHLESYRGFEPSRWQIVTLL